MSRRLLLVATLAAAVIVVVVGIGAPLVGLGVFAGTDRLATNAPWKAQVPTGFRADNVCVADTVDSVIPQHKEVSRQLGAGEFPSWNPLVSGGTRLASTPDPAVFTPLSWPYLFMPTWLAPAWVKFFEMVVAIGGMYLFLRRLTLSPPAGILGGIVFATSGFMISWTNWPQTEVAAFIPALFWAVERFVQLRSVRASVPIALVIACMLLGGFPAVTGYALYAAAPYFVMRMVMRYRRSPGRILGGSATAGLALGLGAGLVGVQLLPFVSQLQSLDTSYRHQTSSVHLAPLSLATALVPNALSNICTGPAWWASHMNQVEALSYIGGAALVLIAVALLRRPAATVPVGVRGFLVLGLATALVLIYVGGPLLGVVQHLPVFSNNYVGRLRSMLGFFAAALAGFGFDRVIRRRTEPRQPWRIWLEAAGWAGAAVAAYLVVTHLEAIGRNAGHLADARKVMLLPLVGAALAFAAVIGSGFVRGRRRGVVLAVIPVIVVVQALAIVRPFWGRVSREEFYPVTPTHRFLAAHLGHDRFVTTGLTMESGSNSYYGLRAATGHAFTENGWKKLLLTVSPKSFASPTYSTLPLSVTTEQLSSPILDLMAVRYVVRSPEEPLAGQGAAYGGTGSVSTLAPGQTIRFPLPTAALRGVGPVLAKTATTSAPFAAVRVTVVSADGTVVAQGQRRLYQSAPAGPFVVPLAGEDAAKAAGPLTARVTLVDAQQPLALESGAGGVRRVVVTDPGDSLRLAFAGGAVVYERTSVLPRFRWAADRVVVPQEPQRLAMLAGARNPGRVVLSDPAPQADGKPAQVTVARDGPEDIRVRVAAQGKGYLVVADALQDSGWRATVDGHAASMRRADEAMVAVLVPAGNHVVRLYDARPRMKTGLLVTIGSAGLLGVAWFTGSPLVAARRRRRAAGATDPTATTEED